jgi:hypothetical protein
MDGNGWMGKIAQKGMESADVEMVGSKRANPQPNSSFLFLFRLVLSCFANR